MLRWLADRVLWRYVMERGREKNVDRIIQKLEVVFAWMFIFAILVIIGLIKLADYFLTNYNS